jgi:hypothetical protein
MLTNINYTTLDNPADSWIQLTSFRSDNNGSSRIMPYSKLYDNNGNPMRYASAGQRRIETYDTTPGMKSYLYHPSEDLNDRRTFGNNLTMRLGGEATFKFIESLSGTFGGTWTRGASTSRTIWYAESLNMRLNFNDGTDRLNPQVRHIPDGAMIQENRGTVDNWMTRAQLNYNQSFDNDMHRISGIVVGEVMKETFERTNMPTRYGYNPIHGTFDANVSANDLVRSDANAIRQNMLFQALPPNLGGYTMGASYGIGDKRRVSWLGNGSYEYNNRYILSGSIRWELSNFFGTNPEYRYKPTWSIGGTYKMHEEEYFADLMNIFSRFSPRLTYGVLGSDVMNYSPYMVLGITNPFFNADNGGPLWTISSFPNNSLRYEKKNSLNFGLDATMLKNRLDVTLDYYRNKSYDLIANEMIDPTLGRTQVPINAGELTNTGIEATITGHIVRTRDFSWTSRGVVSYNHSNVDRFNGRRQWFSDLVPVAMADGRITTLQAGYPVDGLWGPRFAGINALGNSTFYKADGRIVDGFAVALDPDDAVFHGTARPPLDMAWTNSFRYKGFEASFMFVAKMGAIYRQDCFFGYNINNRHVGDRWRKPGDEANTIVPRLNNNNSANFYPFADIFVGNANFLRLRDFTLAYNLPKDLLRRCGLAGARIHFQTRNLFQITAKGVDIDPETAQLTRGQGTGADFVPGYTTMQIRPEFHFGLSINL